MKLSAILLIVIVGGAVLSPVILFIFFVLARIHDKKVDEKGKNTSTTNSELKLNSINYQFNKHEDYSEKSIVFDDEDKQYMQYIVDNSHGDMNLHDAEKIMRVMYIGHSQGLQAALNAFDDLVNELKKVYPFEKLIGKVSFMAGMMVPNGVLTKEESDNLAKKYTNQIMKEEIEKTKKNT